MTVSPTAKVRRMFSVWPSHQKEWMASGFGDDFVSDPKSARGPTQGAPALPLLCLSRLNPTAVYGYAWPSLEGNPPLYVYTLYSKFAILLRVELSAGPYTHGDASSIMKNTADAAAAKHIAESKKAA